MSAEDFNAKMEKEFWRAVAGKERIHNEMNNN